MIRFFLFFCFGLSMANAPGALARTSSPPHEAGSEKAVLTEGEVTGRDVYVRSGPSLNHYEICKLQLGEKVSIVGHEGEWFEILPPKEAFSLISGDFVDTTDQQNGVVNGDNVRVRAGSSLNANKYTVQTLLSRGAKVTILGSNPDGFLRIAPPPGATLWINRQFVNPQTPIAGDLKPRAASATPETTTTAAGRPLDGSSAVRSTDEAGTTGTANMPENAATDSPSPAGVTATVLDFDKSNHEFRRELDALDDAATQELKKSPAEQEWTSLLARYEEIARTADDEVSRVYARHRVDQVRDFMTVSSTIRELKTLNEGSDEVRRAYLEARNRLPRAASVTAPVGMDAEGELRVSALYPPGSIPRRYRLIDPTSTSPRTVAYVEIPANSRMDVDSFLGKLVGIRASQKSLQSSGPNPIPILVASEIVPLDRQTKPAQPSVPATTSEPIGARG